MTDTSRMTGASPAPAAASTTAPAPTADAAARRPTPPWWAVHRRVYDWTLSLARRPYAAWALFLISFAESSIFPVPPDVLLAPLCLGHRRRSWWFATLCTVGSVLGALAGYLIGWLAWDAVSGFMYRYVPGFTPEAFAEVDAWYRDWGVWVLFIAAFTPIPFKVFTIAGGVFGQPLAAFLAVSAIGRAARFYLVAGLLWWIGPRAEPFIDKYFNWLTLAFVVLLVAGLAVVKLMH